MPPITSSSQPSPLSAMAPQAPYDRVYDALLFDWDGTAVASRKDDASALAHLADPLLADGVWLIVVTGTTFENISRQFCELIAAEHRQRLLVCANRGSEVFGFDQQGNPILRSRRVATPDEEESLSRIAEELRDAIMRKTGLSIEIVYHRLNRRKVDLIPEPEWASPAKSEMSDLQQAVETRLASGGWRGGLAAVLDVARKAAERRGVQVRVTSDLKHVEIGLTDKADAATWIRRELLVPMHIQAGAVLIVGDEFGRTGDLPGSDNLLSVSLPDSQAISVGIEPQGVPPGVLHLRGGPSRFRWLLARQIALRCSQASRRNNQADTASSEQSLDQQLCAVFAPSDDAVRDATWELAVQSLHPEREHAVESLLTVSNGFLGVRGSIDHQHPSSHPRTLIAGLFGRINGRDGPPELVPAPNWLPLIVFADGEPVALDVQAETARFSRVLDMRRGMLHCRWADVPAGSGTITVETVRLASQVRRGLGVQVVRITASANMTVTLQVWSEMVTHGLTMVNADREAAVWRVSGAEGFLSGAMHAESFADNQTLAALPLDANTLATARTWGWQACPGEALTLVRIVSFARGEAADATLARSSMQLDDARTAGTAALLQEHTDAWKLLWTMGDVRIRGDADAQRKIRFSVYHLLSAVNPEDERVSIGARGLTGEGYLGHVFWDTDIFLMPFYTAIWPAAARALLLYRHHTLDAARTRAQRLGYRGALYAWESADNGEDVTPRSVRLPDGSLLAVQCGEAEQHISADVAYAVWHYWMQTNDDDFILRAGAEIMVETARFWASRATLGADGLYHIYGVIGPDEYHENVDDNVYTNGMAHWNLRRAVEVVHTLARRWPDRWRLLASRLAIADEEVAAWGTVARQLAAAGKHLSKKSQWGGVIEQFTGYFGLEDIDLADYRGRSVPVDVIFGHDRTERSQVIKQADVVMLLALLPDEFSRRATETNLHYYERRCSHGSSLSPAIHALVAARARDALTAMRYFRLAGAVDLSETASAAAYGVHMGALGGLWLAVAFGFGGLTFDHWHIHLTPHLPPQWDELSLSVQDAGTELHLEIEHQKVTITAQGATSLAPLEVSVDRLHSAHHPHHEARKGRRDGTAGKWKEHSP